MSRAKLAVIVLAWCGTVAACDCIVSWWLTTRAVSLIFN